MRKNNRFLGVLTFFKQVQNFREKSTCIKRMLTCGFVAFSVTQTAKLGNTDRGEQNQIGSKRETEKIDNRAERKRNNCLNILVYEQVGRLVRTDIKHIEVFLQTASVCDLVEDHRNTHRAGKNRHRLQDRLMLKLNVSAVE